MPSNTFAPGELISERFRIVRLIAQGGMGEVYEALDQELDDVVALKVVRSSADFSDEQALQSFRREVQLARKVTHPNVCRLFDVFHHQENGNTLTFVTMELLRGETMAEVLSRQGRFSENEALPLVGQMIAGLSAAHTAGVIHRDLKTSNVMLVTLEGDPAQAVRAVITDFGVALAADPTGASESGGMAGTAAYMAPEQVHGKEITTACDIYSLGVMMYEMLTGQLPHQGDTPLAVLGHRLKDGPQELTAVVPEIAPHWNDAVLRCLEVEPDDRFPSVEALYVKLKGQDTRGHARLPSRTEPDRRIQGLLVALVVVAALAAGFAFRSVRSDAPTAPPSPVQISTWPGLEVDPVFSPDGKTIAFSSDQSGAFEIFTQLLTPGAEATQLTNDGRQCFQPSWSPDGSSIAYYTASGEGGIWTVPAEGGTPSRLTEFGAQPKWSPDGATLAFQSDGRAQLAANSNDAVAPSTIWLVDVKTGRTRSLTRAGQPTGGHGAPAWAPDGRLIYFSSSNRRSSAIWAVMLADGSLTEIVNDPDICLHPVISPDGRSLYFSAVTGGERYGVWRVPLSSRTGKPTTLPSIVLNLGSAIIRHLALSSDGRQMVYSALSTSSNLWSLSMDPNQAVPTGPPTPLTSGTGRNNRPAFSPDGSLIAFDRWHVGVNRAIWVMASDGSSLHRVTSDDATNTHANWLPDSQSLAFLSNSGDSWGLYSSPLQGEPKKLLTALPDDAGFATVSPDGEKVTYHTANKGASLNVWVSNIDGSQARQVTFDAELAGFPTWSPDGRRLVFEVRRGDDTYLTWIPADGGELEILVAEPSDNWPFSSSPDGSKVAFSGKRDGYWNLYWVDFSGEVQQLTKERRLNSYLRYPAWSPTGEQLVFERAETTGDVWMLENLP